MAINDFQIYFGIILISIVIIGSLYSYSKGKRHRYYRAQDLQEFVSDKKYRKKKGIVIIYELIISKLCFAGFLIPWTIISNSYQTKYLIVYVVAIVFTIISITWYVKTFRKYSTPYDSTWQKFSLLVSLMRYGTPSTIE